VTIELRRRLEVRILSRLILPGEQGQPIAWLRLASSP
jgi:hypothetical protein